MSEIPRKLPLKSFFIIFDQGPVNQLTIWAKPFNPHVKPNQSQLTEQSNGPVAEFMIPMLVSLTVEQLISEDYRSKLNRRKLSIWLVASKMSRNRFWLSLRRRNNVGKILNVFITSCNGPSSYRIICVILVKVKRQYNLRFWTKWQMYRLIHWLEIGTCKKWMLFEMAKRLLCSGPKFRSYQKIE